MKSLFLKIFLSYWMAQALFLALAVLITIALRERGESAVWDAQQSAVTQQGDPDLRTKWPRRPAEAILRKFVTRYIPGPTCWMTRAKKSWAATCRAGRNPWQRVSDQRLATFGIV